MGSKSRVRLSGSSECSALSVAMGDYRSWSSQCYLRRGLSAFCYLCLSRVRPSASRRIAQSLCQGYTRAGSGPVASAAV